METSINNKCKAFTSLKQSRKLAEILPLESADMMYHSVENEYGSGAFVAMSKVITNGFENDDFHIDDIPCWSLAALLEAMPQSITKYIESEKCQKTFHLNLFRSYYHCCSYSFAPSISDDDGSNTLYCVGRDNWVDACYELILKLHELNLL